MTLPPLPAGWHWSTVEKVGRLQLGRQRSPQYHQGANMKPYLRVANVFEDRIDTTDVMEMHFEPQEFERFKLSDGDVLLNEGQTPELLGRPAVYRGVPADCAFTNSLIRFQAGPDVLPEWALLVFRAHMHSGRFTRESRITTNIAHLSLGRLRTVEFPVPPLDTQRALVAEAQALSERQGAIEQSLAVLHRRLGMLRLRVARDAAGDSDAVEDLERLGWRRWRLGDLATEVKNGLFVSRPTAEPRGVPILRIGSVRPMSLRLDDLRWTGLEEAAVEGALLREGDLLFTRYNGNPRFVGACAVVPAGTGSLVYPDKLIRVRTRAEDVDPHFLVMALSVGRGRAEVDDRLRTTAGQIGISGASIKDLRVWLPPLEEQRARVADAARVLDHAGQLSSGVHRLDDRLAALSVARLTQQFALSETHP